MNNQSKLNFINSKNIVTVLCIFGLAISLYLTYAKLTSTPVVCKVGDCDAVQNSTYSVLFRVPVAVWGTLYYLALLFLNINENANKYTKLGFKFLIL